jgi:hypothetical protein
MTKTNLKCIRIFCPSLAKYTFLLPSFWIVINNLIYWLGRSAVLLHPRWPLSPALSEYTVREHFTSCRGWLRPYASNRTDSDIWWRAHCWLCCGYQPLRVLENEALTYAYLVRLLVRFPAVLYLLSVTFFLVILSCCKQMLDCCSL